MYFCTAMIEATVDDGIICIHFGVIWGRFMQKLGWSWLRVFLLLDTVVSSLGNCTFLCPCLGLRFSTIGAVDLTPTPTDRLGCSGLHSKG
jgi:hypothetical protein